jgi:hypothetical protein
VTANCQLPFGTPRRRSPCRVAGLDALQRFPTGGINRYPVVEAESVGFVSHVHYRDEAKLTEVVVADTFDVVLAVA